MAEKLVSWKATNLYWLNEFPKPVHVVLYDDLINDLENTLRKTLKFLDFQIDEVRKISTELYHKFLMKLRTA